MILNKIDIINYRNYKKQNISFIPGINIIIGNNAQGKTNILEAIYVLALTKSYRTNVDANLIKFDNDFYLLKGTIVDNNLDKDLFLRFDKQQKVTKINGKKVKKISDYITNFNVILFAPEDIDVIKGSPSIRRNLLNIEISQLSKDYLVCYNEFNKILKTRNDYLKLLAINSISDYRYLNILTDSLIKREISIYLDRKNFIDNINIYIEDIFYNISGIKGLYVKYETNIDLSEVDNELLEKKIRDKYKSINKEINQGITLYGPHRDDFSFFIYDQNIKEFGSQGQQKLALIAFKLAEIYIFKEKTGSYPVVLLDDIFSELDKYKKNKLIKYLKNDIQVIITSNDTKDISKKLLDNAKVFKVINGNIIEKGGKDNERK